ncbi:hypothetical protein BN1708_019870, partial [Verticillium longisporum]
LRHQEGSGAPW